MTMTLQIVLWKGASPLGLTASPPKYFKQNDEAGRRLA
ncbi:hypothetical protein SAMN05444714_2382 [Yoonia litorea]|uniref:Uncharacterized protein n=1 Tax=Yoonia litorea TaxID=1123755 RepID=A0A1I6MVX6_9RHOB|nr:hypothetical protein SAMN05444714_2382 [Yoonia litorea]